MNLCGFWSTAALKLETHRNVNVVYEQESKKPISFWKKKGSRGLNVIEHYSVNITYNKTMVKYKP